MAGTAGEGMSAQRMKVQEILPGNGHFEVKNPVVSCLAVAEVVLNEWV